MGFRKSKESPITTDGEEIRSDGAGTAKRKLEFNEKEVRAARMVRKEEVKVQNSRYIGERGAMSVTMVEKGDNRKMETKGDFAREKAERRWCSGKKGWSLRW